MTFKEFLRKTYDIIKTQDEWIPEDYIRESTHKTTAEKEAETKAKGRGRGYDDRYESNMTFSVSWNMGGTSGSCWNDKIDTVEGDMEPEDGPEFDLILAALTPSISFMEYRVIQREVVKRKQKVQGDYYGGSITEGHKGFNIKDLYEVLNKRGLLK
jgi:hypothetical protein